MKSGKWAPSLCRRFEGSEPLPSLLHCWRGETVRGSLGERSLRGLPCPLSSQRSLCPRRGGGWVQRLDSQIGSISWQS